MPCDCCCSQNPCQTCTRGPCWCNGTCCPPGQYCVNGSCTATVPCYGPASGSSTLSLAPCQTISGFLGTVMIVNDCCCTATLRITGIADDDVIINGSIYEDGQHPYPYWGNPGPCGDTRANGSHQYTYITTVAQGEATYVGGRDNGAGGSVTINWTVTCNPLP